MVQTVHLIAAARPNFMKVAPLYHALAAAPDFQPVLIHTGQHYDANMSDTFFADLKLPAPDHHLGVGSGSHSEQTGNVMIAYEKVALSQRPDWLIVVGDVNSTAACAMVGAKLQVPVVHLEAGLRSFDRRMPEELNRLVTDQLSDVLWTPSPDGDENLAREGIPAARITRVGNIMLDSYELLRTAIEAENAPAAFGLTPRDYGLVTLHRPSNVDTAEALGALVTELLDVAERCRLLFPVHPRTAKKLDDFGLRGRLESAGITLTAPISYRPFMSLVSNARMVITDSGGVQEETTYLNIPCLTLRENTERPVTVTQGTNRLIAPGDLLSAVETVLSGDWPSGVRPDLWDGQTASRCIADLRARTAG